MNVDSIQLKFGEIFLKGINKRRFSDALYETLRKKLIDFPNLKFLHTRNIIYIYLHGEPLDKVQEKLDKIFGIAKYTYCYRTKTDLKSIQETALKLIEDIPQTFKVDTKRAKKDFPTDSMETSMLVGGYVLEHTKNLTVDVKKPDVKIKVDIRNEGTYLSIKEQPALGGLPVGTSGRALLMLSGGLDSPVAGFLMQKRGLEIHAIHFESPPYTSPGAKQKVFDLAEELAKSSMSNKIRVHVIPFTKIQKAIHDTIPQRYGITLMRRMMYRIAEEIATKHECKILGTGECIGQVASQTIESLSVINEPITMPVVRPLISFDKTEIMNLARKFGTYDLSIKPFEDCCTIFVPKNPIIKPTLEKCLRYESFIEWKPLVEEAIEKEQIEIIKVGEKKIVNKDSTCSVENLF